MKVKQDSWCLVGRGEVCDVRRISPRKDTRQRNRAAMTMIRVRNRKMPISRIIQTGTAVTEWRSGGGRRPFKEFEHCVYHAADVCKCASVYMYTSSISVCTAATQHYVCTPRPSPPRVTHSLFSPLPLVCSRSICNGVSCLCLYKCQITVCPPESLSISGDRFINGGGVSRLSFIAPRIYIYILYNLPSRRDFFLNF